MVVGDEGDHPGCTTIAGSGRPMSCPERVEWRGLYRNRQSWHVVDSCDGHVDDKLVGVMRLP